MANIQVQGLSDVLAKWNKAPEVISKHLGDAAEALLLGIAKDLAKYPPAPSESTYRRTGTLGRTWNAARPDATKAGINFSANIGNPTPYAAYVQGGVNDRRPDGKFGQAWIHIGRWQTTDDVVDAHGNDAQERFDHAIDLIVGEL